MRIVAITQARTNSTRLPKKVLKEVNGENLLTLHVKRILKSKRINKLVVATTVNPDDGVIEVEINKLGIEAFKGSESDVLDRFYQAIQRHGEPDFIVRLTADCPLIDAELIDKVIDYAIKNNLDYCSNTLEVSYPDGQDIEVMTYASLKRAWREAKLDSEREHVTPYIWKNSTFKKGRLFNSDNFSEGYSFGHLRMTVDEPKDLEVVKHLVSKLGIDGTWLDYARCLADSPDVRRINEGIVRNEGYSKSINKENEHTI